MIIRSGVDLTTISRFSVEEKIIKRILTSNEIDVFGGYDKLVSMGETRVKQILAGRWAAKEALVKAIGINKPFSMIEIINNTELTFQNDEWYASISISHERDLCISFVVAYKR